MPQGARVTASMPTFVRCLRVGYGLTFDFGVLLWVEISTTKGMLHLYMMAKTVNQIRLRALYSSVYMFIRSRGERKFQESFIWNPTKVIHDFWIVPLAGQTDIQTAGPNNGQSK